MNSKSKVPCIPIEGSISWEDWLKGRRSRRESSQLVAPGVIRRKTQFQRPAVEETVQRRTRPAVHAHRETLREMNSRARREHFPFRHLHRRRREKVSGGKNIPVRL